MDQPAKIVAIPERMQKRLGRGKMLIPSPLDVEAIIKKTPRGKIVTTMQIGERLARAAGVKTTCPMCVGMFTRIVAECAAEEARAGKTRIAPYWRVVRNDGSFNDKFPGGPVAQAEHLEAEGHTVDRSGKFRVRLA